MQIRATLSLTVLGAYQPSSLSRRVRPRPHGYPAGQEHLKVSGRLDQNWLRFVILVSRVKRLFVAGAGSL